MKVNISGRGIIPIVRKVAPAYNVNIDKLTCYKILGSNNLTVFRSSDGVRITRANLDTMFVEKMISDEPVVETPAATPKPVKKTIKKAEKKEVVKEEPVDPVEEAPVEAVVEETVAEVAEEALPEITEENIDEVKEAEPTVVETEATEEIEEEKPQYTSKKKKKNRNNG